jgi:hypothetical protein
MLPKSGFLATVSFMFHLKSQFQPTQTTHPFRLHMGEPRRDPNSSDPMINDAGKQPVNERPNWLPSEAAL